MVGAACRGASASASSASSAGHRGGLGSDVVHPRPGVGGPRPRPRRNPSLDEAAVEEIECWEETVGQE